jgi:magnesium transporter
MQVPASRSAASAADEQARTLRTLDPGLAALHLSEADPADAAKLLALLNTLRVRDILAHLDDTTRERIITAAPGHLREQWGMDGRFEEGSVGSLMEPAVALFRPETPVPEAIETLRGLVQTAFISYGFLTDTDGRLCGVFAFRELLFAGQTQALADIAVADPFFLYADTSLPEAMQQVVTRHFPAYPVCDRDGKLLGLLRGQALFEAQAFEISAQAGKMQGVDSEERISTPLVRSLRFRHPWLQLNLLTAFIAAAVVGFFQDTLDRIIVLAAFLPVLAGQSGNTGCQALAVTLRGMTLGELRDGPVFRLVSKELLLGIGNGLLVGLVAGAGMWYYAHSQQLDEALLLAAIVVVAMTLSCAISGLSGALIPLALRRLGADPATASSIFLTTMTDVVSMGAMLGLASALVP